MSIDVTDDLVAQVALLARLELSDDEKHAMKEHFQKVLRFVDELQELDLSEVDPSLFSLDASNVDREDEPAASLSTEEALRNAPAAEPPFFLLPRVVDAGGES